MINEQKLDALLQNTGDMCLKRRAKLVVSELSPQKKDKILDVGCGDGFYLYLLSHMGDFNLTGIDSDPVALKIAKKQIGRKYIKYVVGDVLKMPFKKESFNKIVCSEVLEHLEDDEQGVKEIKRVLKKNGVACITVPHWNYPFFWDPVNYILQRVFRTHIKSGFWSGVWNFHVRLYKIPELKKLFKDNGLKIERFECVTHYGLPFNHYLTNLGFRLRTSKLTPKNIKKSLSKFEGDETQKKNLFARILEFINYMDRRNNRRFSEKTSTVGLFIKVRKV